MASRAPEVHEVRGGLPKFAPIPFELLESKVVTGIDILVYAGLRYFTDFNGEHGAFPSLETLAKRAHVARSTVARSLDHLKELGWVTWTRTGRSNSYTVRLRPAHESSDGSQEDIRWLTEGHQKSGREPSDGSVADPTKSQLPESQLPRKTLVAQSATTKEPFPADFDRSWSAYPKRIGGNSKKNALKAWNASIRRGATAAEIHAGVERYAKHLRANGTIGTKFVMMTATFFGPGDHFREPWALPPGAETLDPIKLLPPKIPGKGRLF